MAKSLLKISQGLAERDLPFLSNLCSTRFINSQIYARNPKGLAERDFQFKPGNLERGFVSL